MGAHFALQDEYERRAQSADRAALIDDEAHHMLVDLVADLAAVVARHNRKEGGRCRLDIDMRSMRCAIHDALADYARVTCHTLDDEPDVSITAALDAGWAP